MGREKRVVMSDYQEELMSETAISGRHCLQPEHVDGHAKRVPRVT